MATDLGQSRGGKSLPAARYEAFARGQLARVESRIRALDLVAALLGFAAGTLGYAMVLILVDRRWQLSAPVRQGAFLAYLAASVCYLAYAVVRPLRRRVNPYYAALKLEETLPEAKNSVINWVDLHQAELAPAITAAVGQRAARDMARADVEQAVSGKRAGWAGGLAGGLFVLFVTAFILFGPRQFLSLFRRSFFPYEGGAISAQTALTVIRPEGGNAVVPIGRSVTIAVEVTGRLPDPKGPEALRLVYRYQENDPFIERPLQRESGAEWAITLNAFDVQNGFWYKVAGGDAETPEYRVGVRSTPLLTDFRATYHFRAYTGRPAEMHRDRRLEAVRGTEIALRARANRPVKEAFVDVGLGVTRKSIRADLVAGDPHSFQTRLTLEESTAYRIRYNSAEGESYVDPVDFPIVVHPDKAPSVELSKPGRDISLPANGVLNLEGTASDDFGVKNLVLRLQIENGPKLKTQPYRSEKALQLPSGGHPVSVAYKDFVDLAKAAGADSKPFAFVAGQKLEYWLEATDACDYPHANIGFSKHYRVTIAEPVKDPAQEQKERNQAEQEKKQHEAKQDEQLKKEEQQNQEQKERNNEEINKQNEPMNEPKGQEAKSDKDNAKGQGGQPEAKEGQDNNAQSGNDSKDENRSNNQQDIKDKEERLKEALRNKEEKENKQPAGTDQANKGGNDSKDNKNGNDSKDNKNGNDSKDNKNGSDSKDNKNGSDSKDNKNGSDSKDNKNGNDSKDNKNGNDSKDNKNGNDSKDNKNGNDSKDNKNGNDSKDNKKSENQQGGDQSAKGKENDAQQQGADAKEKQQTGGQSDKSEAKDDAREGASKDKPAGQQRSKPEKGDAKDQRPSQGGDTPGDKKDGGKGDQNRQSAGKEPGNDKPGQDPKSLDKNGKPQPKSGNQPGAGKEDGKGDQASRPGEARSGKPGGDKTGEEKPSQKDPTGKSDGKDEGAQGTAAGKPTDAAQQKPGAAERSKPKDSGDRAGTQEPKANPRNEGKEPQGEQTPPGENKQAPGKSDLEKIAKGQTKGDRQPSGEPEERRENLPEDTQRVQRLTRDLKSKDKATRDKARGELERMTADEFEQFKQKYEDLLDGAQPERLKKKDADRGAAVAKDLPGGKSPARDDKEQGDKTAAKEQDPKGSPGTGNEKEKGGPAGEAAKDAANEGGKGKDGKPSDGEAEARGKGARGKSNKTPGPGAGQGNNSAGQGNDQTLEPKPEAGRFRDRAGVLQLEEFKRKVDRNVLKDAKISDEEYRAFLQAYQEQLKKTGGRPVTPEVLPGRQASGALPSFGGQRVAPTGTANDAKAGNRPLPPPRYREAYREFTRQLANPEDREGK